MTWLNKFLHKLFAIRENQERDAVKPFLEHLEDLRITLFKMAFSLAVGMVIAFFYRNPLMTIVQRPLHDAGLTILTLQLTEVFMLSLKLAFYAGVVFSFPFLLYFVAEFVLPALTRKERRLLIPGILASFILFGCGVVVSYFYILPKTIRWFKEYSESLGIPLTQVQAGPYFSFVANLSIACGLLCELPVVVIALSLLNIVSFALLARTRAYAMVLIGILVAILAPSPDPITFITLSLPVMGIYELCIWIVWLIERRRRVS